MNVLHLTLEPAALADERRVRIAVDGVDLVEHARRVEVEWVGSRPNSGPAGDYRALPMWAVKNVRSWLFGEVLIGSPSGEYWSVLLFCGGCDEPGCWPLESRITHDDLHVRWSSFRQPHRLEWQLDALSFRFERAAYEAEIARFLTTEVG